ncbi:hypothetical protein OG756_36500 [Streptomyces sp. NBC_01310]|uniref:hypothetical protein n=1 Tax=Streptomyces sp. NBC_01310 TaxID=2903820 RepID=UPI0035B5D6B1|nr:hypothetical protein OG756_36500 [Streptomyces sp. NBC_01310]
MTTGAYDDHLARVLPRANEQRVWVPADGALPSLFISHGAPFTLDDPQCLDALFTWAQSLPKPKAIVIISAHWEDAPAAISGAVAGTPLHYDFSSFHPRYKSLLTRPRTRPASPVGSRPRSVLRRPRCTSAMTEVSTTARSSPSWPCIPCRPQSAQRAIPAAPPARSTA